MFVLGLPCDLIRVTRRFWHPGRCGRYFDGDCRGRIRPRGTNRGSACAGTSSSRPRSRLRAVKSLLMAFYAVRIVTHSSMDNSTLVVMA